MIICMQQVCDLWIFEHKTLASQGLDIDEIVKYHYNILHCNIIILNVQL